VGFILFAMNTKKDKGSAPHYTGHRERLRGKYLALPESLADYELMELLLTYSIPRRDVKELAKELIANYGSISGVLIASSDDLLENKGISKNSVALFQLVRDLSSKLFSDNIKEKDLFQSPTEVLGFAKSKLAGWKDEVFLIIYVNAKNRMENYEIVNEGTVDQVVIYPRKVIGQALKHNATGLIVIHNHPSGECDPSGADLRLTESLKKAANAMDIKLLDHMIVGGNDYFSFLEEGLL
jgi:DNA repair protein RadC